MFKMEGEELEYGREIALFKLPALTDIANAYDAELAAKSYFCQIYWKGLKEDVQLLERSLRIDELAAPLQCYFFSEELFIVNNTAGYLLAAIMQLKHKKRKTGIKKATITAAHKELRKLSALFKRKAYNNFVALEARSNQKEYEYYKTTSGMGYKKAAAIKLATEEWNKDNKGKEMPVLFWLKYIEVD